MPIKPIVSVASFHKLQDKMENRKMIRGNEDVIPGDICLCFSLKHRTVGFIEVEKVEDVNISGKVWAAVEPGIINKTKNKFVIRPTIYGVLRKNEGFEF